MLDIPGYKVLGTIRATGSNVLFHAMREADGLPVIIKTPMAPSPGLRERERYRREFGILQRLRDVRGVARPYAYERIHERPVLLLERVQGEALSEAVGQPLEVTRFLSLAVSLASTLAEIHSRDVIHKDIKPSNIILEPSGEGRLIDFGVATLQKVEHLDAAPGNLVEGTLAYMSPEQTGRMNRAVDYRTDFYSLGVTFYELLTGERPFHGRDALEWFHAHMAQSPKPPHELNPQVPPVLSAIVMKLLAKVAEERYQSAEGLKADLERYRGGLERSAPSAFTPGEHDVPNRFHLPQRLYGRDAQVSSLLLGFERVMESGRPELFLVSGYPGIGKSSVVHELHKPVVQRRGFFLNGKFDQFQRDVPYATIAQAIRGLVQQLLAGTDAELAGWREQLLRVWEGQGQALVDLVPQLELVVGPQPPQPQLSPAEAQLRFHRVFRQFLGVFATPAHPLVVFLDDLQWADLSSLKLIQQLLSQPETLPVLWIGAYRDNEVSSAHPLVPVLEEVRKAGARLTDIRLEPLGLKQVEQLVGDTLPGAQEELVVPLAGLVHEKTGGNPFFLLQFMVTLSQDGLLVRTPGGGWRWSPEEVRARGYSDNVVDFMVGKLRQLPAGAQQLLRLAACVGNVCSLQMLGTLAGMGEPGEVEQGLGSALQEGLLVRVGPEQYRFLHDRIQQAAHTLLSEEERKAIHLRIGRLWQSLSPEQLRENLFDVVSQLNAGVDLIEDPAERHQVARLNAEAGAKAEAAVAPGPAVAYFSAAFALIPGDPWETDYELAFRVRLGRARCEFLSGKLGTARELAQDARSRARTRADTTAAACLKSDICVATGDIPESIQCVLDTLAMLGAPLSPHPTWEEARAAHEEVWELLGERSIESLVDLPPMVDPDVKWVMTALATLFRRAYNADVRLFVVTTSRIISLSLRYGFLAKTVTGFGWFGVVTCRLFKRYQQSHAWSELALALVERHNLSAFRASVLLGAQCEALWTRPYSEVLELTLGGFHHGLQSGDFYTASICSAVHAGNRLFIGHNLDDVVQELVARSEFVRKAGVLDANDLFLTFNAAIRQLRGETLSFGTMSGHGFDEQAFEARMTPARMGATRGFYWVTKLQGRFLYGSYREALEAAEKVSEFRWFVIGNIVSRDFHLYRALTLAACFEEATAEQQREWLETLQGDQQQLAEWAENRPENFRALERMVAAELARLQDRPDEATRAYEAAIRVARESGTPHFLGLASELAANFWRSRQAPIVAHAFAREARAAYLQWGALGKVQQLDSLWPNLGGSRTAVDTETTSSTDSTRIDALTVVKTQQAISGEIVLERLVTTLMQAAIENAGAQRGALLLPSGDTLSVVATCQAAPGNFTVEVGKGASEELPWTVLSYVKRSREPVLIGDASKPHPFSGDEYLARGAARSVLCLPLMRQEQFTGALYLENNLATDAFSPGRLALLGHIASQAAISIENARLYADVQRARQELRQANDELEQRVEARTQELRQAQARLVDTARAVGMAEVASNVLHNVGNVLTSAVINLEMMQRAVGSSRVGRLKQATNLLLEHREDLSSFLAPGARGGHLPEYLAGMADELVQEQTKLVEDMDAMGRHVEHIRAIVQVQQTYAKSSLMTEECDLGQLIEDALRVQMAALQRHGVSVVRELAPLRKVKVDKHKVLQILINLISNAKNALDVMPEGERHLTVRLMADGRHVRIQVEDDGMGISDEVRAQLFAHGFTTRKDGHGFGLHSSALAAQILGGHLTLESEGPGKGAVATLELPLS